MDTFIWVTVSSSGAWDNGNIYVVVENIQESLKGTQSGALKKPSKIRSV